MIVEMHNLKKCGKKFDIYAMVVPKEKSCIA